MLHPSALRVAREAREMVIECAADGPPQDLDEALDIYALALTDVFGPSWRRYAGPGYGPYLETRLRQGY